MSKLLLGGTFIVFASLISFAYFTLPNTNQSAAAITTVSQQTTNNTSSVSIANTSGTPATNGYTMATVTQHNSASSCWAVINGNVYDLTKWISQHPGGQAPIVSLCGTDGSAAFNGQHGGQRRPASELAGFLLGPLAQ